MKRIVRQEKNSFMVTQLVKKTAKISVTTPTSCFKFYLCCCLYLDVPPKPHVFMSGAFQRQLDGSINTDRGCDNCQSTDWNSIVLLVIK